MNRSRQAVVRRQARLRSLYKSIWGVSRCDTPDGLEFSLLRELRTKLLDLLLFYRRFLVVVCVLFVFLLASVVVQVLSLVWGKHGYPLHFYFMVPLSALVGVSGIALSALIILALWCALGLLSLLFFQVCSTTCSHFISMAVCRVLGLDVQELNIIGSRINRRVEPFLQKVRSIVLVAFASGTLGVLWLFDNVDRVVEYAHLVVLFAVITLAWTQYRLNKALIRAKHRHYVRVDTISSAFHIPLICLVVGLMIFMFIPFSLRVMSTTSEGLFWSIARPAFIVGMTRATEYAAVHPPFGRLKKNLPTREEIVTQGNDLAKSLQARFSQLPEQADEFLSALKPSFMTGAILMVVGGMVIPMLQLKGPRAVSVGIVAPAVLFGISLWLRRSITSIFPSGENAVAVTIFLFSLTVTIAFGVNVALQGLGGLEKVCHACKQENPSGARYCMSCGNVFVE